MSGQFLIINHVTATMNTNLSDHNFVLSYQDGVLVGHTSFQVKQIICSSGFLKPRFSKQSITLFTVMYDLGNGKQIFPENVFHSSPLSHPLLHIYL